MDDLNALERQIGDELRREIGPVPRFDAATVVRSVATTTPRGRWSVVTRLPGRISLAPAEGGFTMFSALKFIAAGVIVTLFGGLLLAGVLTTQQDGEVLPAAVTESPSPKTTEELLSGMITEEVEPGVLRVIDDEFREPSDYEGITIGTDDTVWISDAFGPTFQLGAEQALDFAEIAERDGWQPYEVGAEVPLLAGSSGRFWAMAAPCCF